MATDDGQVNRYVLDPEHGLVVGTVRDRAGKPVAGIHVSLLRTDHTELTGETGQFVFANVPAGNYEFRADAKGYRAAEARIKVPAHLVTRVTITMIPVSGGEVGPDGLPVEGAPSDERGSASGAGEKAWFRPMSVLRGPAVEVPQAWFTLGVPLAIVAAAAFSLWFHVRRPSYRVKQGRAALRAGRAVEAERLARKALARSPAHADAWFLLGASLIGRGAYSDAVRELEVATSKYDPEVAGLAFLITLAHGRMGKPENARKWLPVVARDRDYWEALEHDPNTAFQAWVARGGLPKRVDPAYA